MRIYKTRWLARFTRCERIADESLIEAVERAERGLIDADLGHGLIKQRVARGGQGRSGGYRMLVAYRGGRGRCFVYGFAKSEQAKLEPYQMAAARAIGGDWLGADGARIERAIEEDELMEISCDEESD